MPAGWSSNASREVNKKKSFFQISRLVDVHPSMMAASVAERPLFIKLNLPDGLEEALEGLAREVLREKPGNIYEFAADYFEELVKKRNEGIKVAWESISSRNHLEVCS